jgi:hypothetical protein
MTFLDTPSDDSGRIFSPARVPDITKYGGLKGRIFKNMQGTVLGQALKMD